MKSVHHAELRVGPGTHPRFPVDSPDIARFPARNLHYLGN